MRSPTGAPQQVVESKETVVYLVPKSPDLILGRRPEDAGTEYHDALRGIGFKNQQLSQVADSSGNLTTEALSCGKIEAATNRLLCTKSRDYGLSSGRGRWYAYHAYYVAVSSEERPDGYVVTLQPVVAEAKADRSIAKSLSAPPFPVEEVLDVLASGCFRVKMEIDSQFDQESVQANFTRLLGAPGHAYSAKKADVKSYKLKGDAYEANLVVELWPYRGGTKAAVTAVVTAQPTSVEPGIRRTIDVQKAMDMVRKEIEKIVKS